MRNLYILQPYEVGSKKSKSLAIVIPADVARKYKIDTSTAFALKTNSETNMITLQQTRYHEKEDRKEFKPTEQGFDITTQQALRVQ
jgi:antitoxin component of MazEF toxin-antitoxin module